jgi:hypothetical protein
MAGAGYWLTTERLALWRFTPGDLDWLAELYSDRDVTRYLGGVKDRAKAEEHLNTRILQYYDEHPGLGIWMTVERATGTCLGFHLLKPYSRRIDRPDRLCAHEVGVGEGLRHRDGVRGAALRLR